MITHESIAASEPWEAPRPAEQSGHWPRSRPVVPYKLRFSDRTTLEGALPFEWQPDVGRWEGLRGFGLAFEKGPSLRRASGEPRGLVRLGR